MHRVRKLSLSIDEIITFREVADSGSLMNASKKLGIQFSTASYHITKIEKYFNTTLFDRMATGVLLNDNGRKFYSKATRILELVEESQIDLARRGDYIRIKMGEIPSIIFMEEFLKQFQGLHPRLKIEIKPTSYGKCLKDVNTGKADVAVVGESCMSQDSQERIDEIQIEDNTVNLCTDGFILIAPVNHPLSTKESCRVSEILKYNLISLPSDYGVEMSVRKELKKRNINIDRRSRRVIVENLNHQISMVLSGVGVAITSKRVGLALEALGRVRAIPIENLDAERQLYVVFSRYFKNEELKSDIISTLSHLC